MMITMVILRWLFIFHFHLLSDLLIYATLLFQLRDHCSFVVTRVIPSQRKSLSTLYCCQQVLPLYLLFEEFSRALRPFLIEPMTAESSIEPHPLSLETQLSMFYVAKHLLAIPRQSITTLTKPIIIRTVALEPVNFYCPEAIFL